MSPKVVRKRAGIMVNVTNEKFLNGRFKEYNSNFIQTPDR